MTERTGGLRRVLSVPQVYSGLQRVLGDARLRRVFVDEYVAAEPGMRVLDAGCGPGSMREALPDVSYVGFDVSEPYVEAARARFGPAATFHLGSAAEVLDELRGPFDRVIAVGVLHHLADDEARELLELAAGLMAPDGRFVNIDPTFVDDQARAARFVIARDHGQAIRTPEQLEMLAATAFSSFETTVRHDLLRIPYTHVIGVGGVSDGGRAP